MIKYKKGYRFQLHEDFGMLTPISGHSVITDWCNLSSDGYLKIYAKYAWDGRSGIVRRDKTKKPSLVHDVFSQMARQELIPMGIKKQVDELYRDMLIDNDVWAWYANADLVVLSHIDNYFDPDNRRETLCAP